jgi:hypothetical protein
MNTQRDLFSPCLASVNGSQGELFASAGDLSRADCCPACGAYRVTTASGYATCPAGHERLHPTGEHVSDGELFRQAATVHAERGELELAEHFSRLSRLSLD